MPWHLLPSPLSNLYLKLYERILLILILDNSVAILMVPLYPFPKLSCITDLPVELLVETLARLDGYQILRCCLVSGLNAVLLLLTLNPP